MSQDPLGDGGKEKRDRAHKAVEFVDAVTLRIRGCTIEIVDESTVDITLSEEYLDALFAEAGARAKKIEQAKREQAAQEGKQEEG